MPGTGRPPTAPAYVAAAGGRGPGAQPAASAFAAAAGSAMQDSPGGGLGGEVRFCTLDQLEVRLSVGHYNEDITLTCWCQFASCGGFNVHENSDVYENPKEYACTHTP